MAYSPVSPGFCEAPVNSLVHQSDTLLILSIASLAGMLAETLEV
jgi:hypothetical protein